MDFVELYYNLIWGCYPFNDNKNKAMSQNLIDYLIEAGVSEDRILDFIEKAPRNDRLSPDILPVSLWENSLLLRDVFYYHNLLHIKPEAPTWDPINGKKKSDKFYLEMKIMFSVEDILDYYYSLFNIEHDLRDAKKDAGSVNYLSARFAKFSFIESVDFILFLMDYAKGNSNNYKIKNILDILTFEMDVYESLKSKVDEANLAKANKIIWR